MRPGQVVGEIDQSDPAKGGKQQHSESERGTLEVTGPSRHALCQQERRGQEERDHQRRNRPFFHGREMKGPPVTEGK